MQYVDSWATFLAFYDMILNMFNYKNILQEHNDAGFGGINSSSLWA